jgi:integrase
MLVAEEGITFDEANALIETAGKVGRQPLRDQCLLRLIYRHGLRASEARDAKWTDFEITAGSGLGWLRSNETCSARVGCGG